MAHPLNATRGRTTTPGSPRADVLLDNGLRIVVETADIPAVALSVAYAAGYSFDPPASPGLAHLVEHLTFAADEEERAEIGRDYARHGIEFNARTSDACAEYFTTTPREALEQVIRLEAMRMQGIAVGAETRDVIVSGMREEIEARHGARFGAVPWPTLAPAVWADEAHAHDGLGSPDRIATYSIDHAAAFHRQRYSPHRAVLAVRGPVDPDDVVRHAERWFGGIGRRGDAPMWEEKRYAPRTVTSPGGDPLTAVLMCGQIATHAERGAPDPSVDALAVAGEVLIPLLNDRVRVAGTEWGPAPADPSLLSTGTSSGFFGPFRSVGGDVAVVTAVTVDPEAAAQVVRRLRRKLELLASAPPPDGLLEQACEQSRQLRAALVRDDGERARLRARTALLHGRPDLHTEPIDAGVVPATLLQTAARRMLDGGIAVHTVLGEGP